MLYGLFLTLGVAVLSVALRSYQSSFAQKAGALGILISTYLAVYFLSGSVATGLVAALGWAVVPLAVSVDFGQSARGLTQIID